MATKDLIKKMTKPQSTKRLVKPEQVSVKVVALSGDETVEKRVEAEVKKMTKQQPFYHKLDLVKKQLISLGNRCNALQEGMDTLLETNQELEERCDELEERVKCLERPWYKRLFKCR